MEAHVATLVVAGVLVLASAVQISATDPTIMTTTSDTATSRSITTSTARPSATGLEFCDVSQPILLTAGSQRFSTRLRLTPPSPPRPCRVEVTTLASNDLRLELVPAAPVEAPETPDEGDDEYDGRRLEFPLGPSVPDDGGDRGAIANPGMQVVSLIRQDAARRGSTANASCTLALYVQGEVAWAVNLCDPKTVDDANHPDGALAKMPSGLSLVWTPPRPGQTVRAAALSITAVRKEVPADNLCSVGSVKLAGRGLESAVALELRDGRAPEDRAEPCRVAVEAPGTYLLSLLLVRAAAAAEPANSASSYSSSADSLEADDGPLEDVENAEDAATEDAAPALDRAACGLSVIVGCSTQDPLWSVDLCDPEAAAALNSTELFSSHVTLVWTSPPLPGAERGSPATTPFASTIILTAIGRGATCQSSQFTPCQRRGHYPLCVSRELECDGYHNCPLLAEDEDPNMCNRRHRLIESPGQEKEQKSFPADAKDLLFEFLTNHRRQYSPNGSRPDTSLQTEPSPDTLSNYGPWGYLMLGMLVCGAFLMLCGLWECCCRQPKPTPAAPSHTPTTVLMPQVGVSGGVLVLDSDLDDDPQRPPAYDDLDQPPAYGALFPPGQPKLDDDPAVGAAPAPVLALSLMADAPFPAVDDVASLHSSPSTSSVTSASSLAPS